MPLDLNKVQKIMLEKGVNQTDLAQRTSLSRSRISYILKGKSINNTIKTIHYIAKALEVEPIEIVKE
ncbi:MAG: helix-turn-helix transcriptional regulator [Romboutsia sp.]|nr:helix-turn-helix transcriptional regulator [Romboutsia sp.]